MDKMLYIFVEGDDDDRFFNKIVLDNPLNPLSRADKGRFFV
jgi:hypothetical protein